MAGSNAKFAFTLAEVLITLGIIGVVAVLTLPNLMSDYRKKTYVAQLQRVYNQIQTAAQNCMADEDVDNLNDTYLNIRYPFDDDDFDYESQMGGLVGNSAGRFLKKYFRVTKDCGSTDIEIEDCLAESYKGVDGGISYPLNSYDSFGIYCVNINTGSTVCMNPFVNVPDADGSIPIPVIFTIDVNGKSGPNTWGRDVFRFDMNGKGDLSESLVENRADECLAGISDSYGRGCFDKIIADGWKMDY